VKIVVESIETTNERWIAALKGKATSKLGEETISVSSWDVLGRILSPPRLQILSVIPALKPKSISALAKAMKKDFKNVYFGCEVSRRSRLGHAWLESPDIAYSSCMPLCSGDQDFRRCENSARRSENRDYQTDLDFKFH